VRKLNYCCGVKQTRGFKWAWMYRFGTKREDCVLFVVILGVVKNIEAWQATDADKNARFLRF
jgi:hypothetical protein